jgi:hypothetical protein
MIDPIQLLEHATFVAPCGVRFWDDISSSAVRDGLSVTAYLTASAVSRVQTTDQRKVISMQAPRQQAFLNRQGVYVLRGLPGLRDTLERGEGDADYWAHMASATRSFTIEVIDQQRRFLPCTFPAQLPAQHLFSLQCETVNSPLSPALPTVPLFSAPMRQVPTTIAIIRAELWDLTMNVPASWAILEAHIVGHPPVRGMADFYGRVALFFPYPEPVNALLGSPLQARSTRLIDQSWQVQLQAAYSYLDPVPLLPDLCTTLNLPSATLWVDATSSHLLPEVTLKFGQELFVHSEDATKPSKLLITPSGPASGNTAQIKAKELKMNRRRSNNLHPGENPLPS